MLTDALKNTFASLANQMSPENVSCDGEISRSQVRIRMASLRRQWKAAEAQAGRKVTEDETWAWSMAQVNARMSRF